MISKNHLGPHFWELQSFWSRVSLETFAIFLCFLVANIEHPNSCNLHVDKVSTKRHPQPTNRSLTYRIRVWCIFLHLKVDIYGKRTLSETNSLPLKIDIWKTILSFLGGRPIFRAELLVLGILWVIWRVSIQGTFSNLPAFHGTEQRHLNADSGPWTSNTLCQVRALQTSLESWKVEMLSTWQLRRIRKKHIKASSNPPKKPGESRGRRFSLGMIFYD